MNVVDPKLPTTPDNNGPNSTLTTLTPLEPSGWTAIPRVGCSSTQVQPYFSLTRAQVRQDAATGKVNPLILTIKTATQVRFTTDCQNNDRTYFILGMHLLLLGWTTVIGIIWVP